MSKITHKSTVETEDRSKPFKLVLPDFLQIEPVAVVQMPKGRTLSIYEEQVSRFTEEGKPAGSYPVWRIFVRTAEGEEFQAFTWCRDEASGIARAWREGVEFGHDVAAVWAEAI